MNTIKYNKLCELIKVKAAEIQYLLPPLPSHSERCAPAHLWGALKACYGGYPIKKLPDIEYDNCVSIIRHVSLFPEDVRDYDQMIPSEMFRDSLYITKASTLEDFFE